jgi:hypothetical protein
MSPKNLISLILASVVVEQVGSLQFGSGLDVVLVERIAKPSALILFTDVLVIEVIQVHIYIYCYGCHLTSPPLLLIPFKSSRFVQRK